MAPTRRPIAIPFMITWESPPRNKNAYRTPRLIIPRVVVTMDRILRFVLWAGLRTVFSVYVITAGMQHTQRKGRAAWVGRGATNNGATNLCDPPHCIGGRARQRMHALPIEHFRPAVIVWCDNQVMFQDTGCFLLKRCHSSSHAAPREIARRQSPNISVSCSSGLSTYGAARRISR